MAMGAVRAYVSTRSPAAGRWPLPQLTPYAGVASIFRSALASGNAPRSVWSCGCRHRVRCCGPKLDPRFAARADRPRRGRVVTRSMDVRGLVHEYATGAGVLRVLDELDLAVDQ